MMMHSSIAVQTVVQSPTHASPRHDPAFPGLLSSPGFGYERGGAVHPNSRTAVNVTQQATASAAFQAHTTHPGPVPGLVPVSIHMMSGRRQTPGASSTPPPCGPSPAPVHPTCLVNEAVNDAVEGPAFEMVGLAGTLLAFWHNALLSCITGRQMAQQMPTVGEGFNARSLSSCASSYKNCLVVSTTAPFWCRQASAKA